MSGIKVYGSKRLYWLHVSLISVITLFLQSCGVSDGSGSGGYQLAGGGVGGTGYSSGTVSSFGSIYSNGIHFDTRNAEIIIEGRLAARGDAAAHEHLNMGQIVRIEGDIHDDDTGVAQRVYYDKIIVMVYPKTAYPLL